MTPDFLTLSLFFRGRFTRTALSCAYFLGALHLLLRKRRDGEANFLSRSFARVFLLELH
jgi:hypothetical protein